MCRSAKALPDRQRAGRRSQPATGRHLYLRGGIARALFHRQRTMDWTLGGFHALNTDDIISVASPIIGHVFFQNAGNTLRRGIEANLTYTWDRWNIYGNFTYVDATFRNALTLSSPFNPFANANGDIFVVPGDHITRRPIRHPPTGVGSIFLPKFLRSAAQVKSNAPTRYRFPAPAKQRHRPWGCRGQPVHPRSDETAASPWDRRH